MTDVRTPLYGKASRAMGAALRNPCGAQQRGYASSRKTSPCVMAADHAGDHANAFGDRWAEATVPQRVNNPTCSERRPSLRIGRRADLCVLPAAHSDDHQSANGESWAPELRSFKDADLDLLYEVRTLTRRLDGLYAAQAAGDESVLLRDRVRRLEALLMAMQGHPEALSA